jgi:hypothetical protein
MQKSLSDALYVNYSWASAPSDRKLRIGWWEEPPLISAAKYESWRVVRSHSNQSLGCGSCFEMQNYYCYLLVVNSGLLYFYLVAESINLFSFKEFNSTMEASVSNSY